ncbi:hypothetical protein SAMN03080599_01086 [Acidaminobacter hydrogenoformans DSM 2784]|uniref:N-acetyltransferase domain-containing protein n=2 Tax=Acidaminobacter TaxID=65402 RepID=A0A1G5RW35_9FIRM|nr:hypothetical protein SAMN03080599_01086 [Acidaminobacter hydrogenoformans DSM 2784]
MTTFNSNYFLELADQNLAAAILHRNSHAPHGSVAKKDQSIMFNIGIDNMDGHLNGVLCLGQTVSGTGTGPEPEALFNEAKTFFGKDKRGFVIWVRDHADFELETYLKGRGYKPLREPGSTGMMIQKPIEMPVSGDGIEIKKVMGSQEAADYAAVVRDAFDKSEAVAREMFGSLGSVVAENVGAWVVYGNHRPKAGAMMVASGEAAGIYYVGTVADERGKGLGALATVAATNGGFELGAKCVVLQASIAGEKVYRRLGYEAITHYRWYLIPAEDL